MPITIQNNKLQIRNAEGNYVNIDAVSDATVEERITEINAIGASNIAAINTKAQEVSAQLATSGEMEDMIAETFNINTPYSAGSYVIQDDNGVNKLYRFNVDHAAGDWNDNEVTQVMMGEEFQNLENNAQADVDDLKSALDNFKGDCGYAPIPLQMGKSIVNNTSSAVIIPSNITNENGFCCLCVPCQKGDLFSVTGTGGSSTRLWAFSDADGVRINGSLVGASETDLVLTAPEGSAYFSFNSKTNNGIVYSVYSGKKPIRKFEEIDGRIDANTEDIEKLYTNTAAAQTSADNAQADVDDLKSAVNQRPIAVKTFVIPAGQSHSSAKDKLLVDIKAGEKYIIAWGNANQAYVYYSDGTYFSKTSSPIEGTAEKDISSIGLYRGAPSEDVTAYIIAYYNPVGYDMYKTLGEVDGHDKYIERLKHMSVGKNLVDNVTDKYFPVYIKAGEKVTWSCQDGEPLVSATFTVNFYDKNKTQVSSYESASFNGRLSRTVTPSDTTDIYYIMLKRMGSYQWRSLQIEMGDTATDYEGYIPNNLAITEEIAKIDRYVSKNVSFTLNAGTSHSSINDKLEYNIKAGETYGVYVKSNVSRRVELYEYNGTTGTSKGNIQTNSFYLKTSTNGATDLSLFVLSGSDDANFTLIAFRSDSMDALLQEIISDSIPDVSPIDLNSRTVEFTVNANSSHSSLNNQILLPVNEGEYFYAVATGVQKRTNNSVYIRNDEEEASCGPIADGIVTRFKAPINGTKFGLFLNSGAEEAKINFTIFSEKSVLAKLTEKAEYDNQYLIKLLNAKRKANPGNYNNQTSPEIFTLAHFSDIHGSSWAMKQVQEFKDAYQAQLDDVICTGDIVNDKISDGTAFWDDNSDGTILTCIGNHDSLGSNGWANPVDQQTLYETYIEPYEDNWDAETVSGHSYWYKDYSEKKIRLIAVDATIYDTTEQASQMTWLNAALSGAITNGYAVVGAIHFPPMPANFQKIDSNFTALLHGTAGDMSQFAWHTYHTDILDAIDQFIDDGGSFVCWLSGHTHYDLVSYDNRFPKQLFITISCAMPSSLFEEKIRDSTRGAGLVLNTVCVDTVRKYVKLLRYGAEWDDCLRHTGTCVIKYDANPPEVMYQN